MAKMTFERLRARVLPRVSETPNVNKTEVISPFDQEGRETEDITLDAAIKVQIMIEHLSQMHCHQLSA